MKPPLNKAIAVEAEMPQTSSETHSAPATAIQQDEQMPVHNLYRAQQALQGGMVSPSLHSFEMTRCYTGLTWRKEPRSSCL